MKKSKVILLIFVCVAVILLFYSCGLSSKSSIVGKWESDEESGVFYDNIEFFSDGTYVTEVASWNGTYTMGKDRLRFSGVLHSEVFSFKISGGGKMLTLTNDRGYSKIYVRVN